MQAIWLVEALNDAHLLNGPVWLLFFTLFMAVVSSIMFVITNKDDPSAAEYYAAAQRGFTILEKFAPSNQMARNYTESLRVSWCCLASRAILIYRAAPVLSDKDRMR